MKKFELKKGMAEISYNDRKEIKEGCVYNKIYSDGGNTELIKSFDTLEEAREELKKQKSYISHLMKAGGHSFYEIEECWIEENDYDEDGEFLAGGDAWEFSKMPEVPED